MSKRLDVFVNELTEENSQLEVAASIQNGEIPIPDWICFEEGTDQMKLWDEANGSAQSGFRTLWY